MGLHERLNDWFTKLLSHYQLITATINRVDQLSANVRYHVMVCKSSIDSCMRVQILLSWSLGLLNSEHCSVILALTLTVILQSVSSPKQEVVLSIEIYISVRCISKD